MTKHSYIRLNGKIVPAAEARVHIIAPAIQYAATVFEGVRGYWNAERQQLYLFRLDDHLRRLEFSMKVMRFDPPGTLAEIRAGVIETIHANMLKEDIHLRILAYLDGPPVITATGPVGLAITAGSYPKNEFSEKGMACAVSSWTRLPDNTSPPRVKVTANYNNGRLAAIQAKSDGYDAPILLSSSGHVSEGPQANLFMVRNNRVVTPRLTDGILESITRATLIDLFRKEHGLDTEERAIDRSELYAAEELFFCGSGLEIRPITSVDRLPVGDGHVGAITRKITASYFACVRGTRNAWQEWLTPVW